MFRLDRVDKAEQYLRRAVDKPGANAVVLDHLGDVLRRRGSVREAVEYWRKALRAEDDGEDLDRAGVERKIREAQASLNEAAQVKRPVAAPRRPGSSPSPRPRGCRRVLRGAAGLPPAAVVAARRGGALLQRAPPGVAARARSCARAPRARWPSAVRTRCASRSRDRRARASSRSRAAAAVGGVPGRARRLRGAARAEDLESLLGVALAPSEVMDLLTGVPSPRVPSYARAGAPPCPARSTRRSRTARR